MADMSSLLHSVFHGNSETPEEEKNNSNNSNNNTYNHPWKDLKVEHIVSIHFRSLVFEAAFCPVGCPSHQRIVEDWSDTREASELNKNLAALLIDKKTKETVAIGFEAEELYTKAQQKKEDDKYMYFEHFKPYLYNTENVDK
eukprot:7222_1